MSIFEARALDVAGGDWVRLVTYGEGEYMDMMSTDDYHSGLLDQSTIQQVTPPLILPKDDQ